MTSISPPSNKIWWNEPIEKAELLWISIVFLWGLVMTFMMPYWHVVGDQNLSSEAYKVTPEYFQSKTQEMVDKYTVRTETERDFPVVHPPEGEDIYLIARLWDWWPILELEANKTYRLHVSAMDWQHGFSLQPTNLNVQILPGYDIVMTLTPDKAGEYSIVCNEYCGIGHHKMIGKIYVTE